MPIPDNIPSNSINKNFGNGKQEPPKEYRKLPDNMQAKPKKKGYLLSMILPDDIPDVKTYLMSQRDSLIKYILLPKIQQILLESFSTIIGLGGQVKSNNSGGGLIPKVSYNRNNYNYQSIPMNSPPKGRSYTLYQDILLPSEESCKEFKEIIRDIFYDQGYVQVLQYMNSAGLQTYPDQANFGWTAVSQIDDMHWRYTVDGWLVIMPKPNPLDV